jgi:hypothetical protein
VLQQTDGIDEARGVAEAEVLALHVVEGEHRGVSSPAADRHSSGRISHPRLLERATPIPALAHVETCRRNI